MSRFRRIGVFLRGLAPDQTAIAYAARLSRLDEVEQFHFINIPIESQYEPEGMLSASQIEQTIHEQLPGAEHKIIFRDIPKGGLPDVLRVARDDDLDLLIKGRTLPSQQTAATAMFTRLVRKAPCSVLLVPDQVRPHLRRMMVPIDFSPHSRLSVELAIELGRLAVQEGKPPQLLVTTVFAVGYGYAKVGLTFAEAARNVEEATLRNLTKFMETIDTSGVDVELCTLCSEQPERIVVEQAAARKMDIVMVGSRGLSSTAAVVLGSFAEHVLQNSSLPVMVVKQKGETTSLLNALLG